MPAVTPGFRGAKARSAAVGQRFGRLTILELTNRRNRSGKSITAVVCECDCGTIKSYDQSNVTKGHTNSCGCLRKEVAAAKKPGLKHGMHKSSEYKSWVAMRERCYRDTHIHFRNYGGRGITVCKRWRDSFEAFYEDMGPKPFPGASIERIDNEGDYGPGNCRWETARNQANNRRNNVIVTYRGQQMTMAQAARASGVNYSTLRERRRSGIPESRWFS